MRIHINFSVVLPLFVRIAQELQSHYEVEAFSGFVYGKDSLHQLERLNFPTEHVRAFTRQLERFSRARLPDIGYLRAKEEEYGEPHLYPMIAGCRFVSQFERNKALLTLEACFRLIEQLFDEFEPDVVLSDGVACTCSYVQYAVAKGRGIPFYSLATARINDRFYIIRNKEDRYERVDEIFESYKRYGLPAEKRGQTEAFLNRFRADSTKPAYFVQYAKPPALDLKSLETLFEVAHRRLVLDPNNYILDHPLRAIVNRAVRIAKAHVLDKRSFAKPVDGEKFVFFPLHFQPEMTTLVLAPYYVDQIALIENIAKSLPIDHVLYVKEHKASLGRRPLGYYGRIRKIPNVRLITPYYDSHELIRACSAVCVISSTVGWEAILYEKPVLTFGDVFYNSFDLVDHVRSYHDLPAAIMKAVRSFEPDRELLLEYIAANIEGTFNGDTYYTPGGYNPCIDDGENVRKVSQVVAAELGIPERAVWCSPEPGSALRG